MMWDGTNVWWLIMQEFEEELRENEVEEEKNENSKNN